MKKYITKKCKHHGPTKFVLEGRGYYRCKQCRQDRVAEQRRKNKKAIADMFGGKCLLCGYDKHVGVLDFHHLNRSTKSFAVSAQGMTKQFNRLVDEAKKCILLCSNCHREVEMGLVQIPKESIDNYFKNANIVYKPKIQVRSNCQNCDKILSDYNANHCKSCSRLNKTKIDWPSVKDLKIMVDKTSYSQVGRKLGVSDNAVRKRIKTQSSIA